MFKDKKIRYATYKRLVTFERMAETRRILKLKTIDISMIVYGSRNKKLNTVKRDIKQVLHMINNKPDTALNRDVPGMPSMTDEFITFIINDHNKSDEDRNKPDHDFIKPDNTSCGQRDIRIGDDIIVINGQHTGMNGTILSITDMHFEDLKNIQYVKIKENPEIYILETFIERI